MSRLFIAGDPAPDATLYDYTGQSVTFSDLWKKQPTAFFFLRHFGCPNCRAQAIQLRRNRNKLAAANLHIILIGLGDADAAAQFRKEYDLPFIVLCDPTLRIYARYGLLKMSPIRELEPANVRRTLQRSGEYGNNLFSFMKGQNILQLGGIFVVDQQGIVRFAQRSRHQSDFPPIETILATLKEEKLVQRAEE
jgi:peroxiredoxin